VIVMLTSRKKYESQFVSDETIPDNTPVEVGSVFTKKWKVRNPNPRLPWPRGVQLLPYANENFHFFSPKITETKKRHEYLLSVILRAPNEPKEKVYFRFQLATKDKRAFGHQFWALVKVIEKKDSGRSKDIESSKANEYYLLGKEEYKKGNFAKAIKLFRRAGDNPPAQHELGGCYYWGKGVTKNVKEATKLFLEAANAGFTSSQSLLGFWYKTGQDVKKDMKESVRWYSKASLGGNKVAAKELKNIFKEHPELKEIEEKVRKESENEKIFEELKSDLKISLIGATTTCLAGEVFTVTYIVKNSSSKTFPSTKIRYLYGDNKVIDSCSHFSEINPGGEIYVRIQEKAPNHIGTLTPSYCLTLADKEEMDLKYSVVLEPGPITILPLFPKKGGEFNIKVKDLMGRTDSFSFSSEDNVFHVKLAVQKQRGIPPKQQRIIYAGKDLEDYLPLHSYGIREGSELHLVLRMDIGIFADHFRSPGRHLLTQSSVPCITKGECFQLIADLKGNASASFRSFPGKRLLTQTQIHTLKSYINDMYESEGSQDADFKMSISKEKLSQVVNFAHTVEKKFYSEIKNLLGKKFTKIRLRRCSAIGKHINFHVDVATVTLQVPLNNDFRGGNLVYVNAEGIQIPVRPAGSCTIHGCDIVHGVTELLSGVRYSLFFSR